MSIVYTNEGERYLLQLMLRGMIGEDIPTKFVWRVYTNNAIPHREWTLANVIQAAFAGYVPIDLIREEFTIPTTVGGAAQSLPGNGFLEVVNTSGIPVDVYGWYVTDEANTVLICAELIPLGPHVVDADSPYVTVIGFHLRSLFEPAPP